MMRILVDLGHPAHVHLFKNFIFFLAGSRYRVTVVSREKDVAGALLNHYGIEHIPISRVGKGPLTFGLELCRRDSRVFGLHWKNHFDLAFGTAVSIAHLSCLTGVRSYVFEEDDDDIVPYFSWLTYPFATGIVVPQGLRFKRWRKKRIIHPSYHELAYLHPDHFTPDPEIPKKYGLSARGYIIVRNSALKAHHDVAKKGLVGKTWDEVMKLAAGFPVVTSREGYRDRKVEPWDMHHLLAFCRMLISDSQTMTMEAACLGTPSIRYSSFVGRISVVEELEHRYGLTSGFRPGREKDMFRLASDWMSREGLHQEWQEKRKRMLNEKVNFADWMVRFFRSLL